MDDSFSVSKFFRSWSWSTCMQTCRMTVKNCRNDGESSSKSGYFKIIFTVVLGTEYFESCGFFFPLEGLNEGKPYL